MPTCPSCSSEKTVKNDPIHNGKARFKCCDCSRQFVENPEKIAIDHQKRELIDRLLLERISLAGISRAVKVSEKWLQTYVNDKYATVPRTIQVTPKNKSASRKFLSLAYLLKTSLAFILLSPLCLCSCNYLYELIV